jgi:hypothetical protein
MRKFIPAVCVLSLAMSQAFADEISTEPAVTAYWQIPLAQTQTGSQRQAFGLRMDQVARDGYGNLISSFAAPLREPIVDFRFNDHGLRGIFVHGVNLTTPAMLRAAENDDDDDKAVWWIVGGTVAAMVGLAVWADDQGGVTTAPGGGGELPAFTEYAGDLYRN